MAVEVRRRIRVDAKMRRRRIVRVMLADQRDDRIARLRSRSGLIRGSGPGDGSWSEEDQRTVQPSIYVVSKIRGKHE